MLTMAAAALALWWTRDWAIAELSTPAARADWEEWRQNERDREGTGPARRRVPKSPEPPALVLLRETRSFVAVVALSLACLSMLFGFLMLVARGSRRGGGASR